MRWPSLNLLCDSDCLRRDAGHEVVDAISLCFHNIELEELFRAYQFELASNSLNGKFGSLSLTSMASSGITLAIIVNQIITSLKQITPGAAERMLTILPLIFFGLYHQFRVQLCSRTTYTTEECQKFVWQFIVLCTYTESVGILVNDSFPEYEGCNAHRFRCPNSFSSPKFNSRLVTAAAMIVFHLTPCKSIVDIIQMLAILCGVNRMVGLFIFTDFLWTSLWSLLCTYLQIAIFVCYRYVQDLQDRKRFLLLLHIARLRTNFQEVLDSMMPRSVSERLQAGQLVIDPCESAVVLLCSFPPDAPIQQDVMQAYALVDRVHQVVRRSTVFLWRAKYTLSVESDIRNFICDLFPLCSETQD
jgi:hypothetical protein